MPHRSTQMNCYKCRTPIPDESRFCSACGADVSGDSHAHAPDATIAVDQDPQLFARLQSELGSEYVLERELGRGGMAVVYLGRDAHLGRRVAVKVLPPELTYGGGGSIIERFKREAQTAAKLDHPNIIPVYRVAPGGTLFWYVMKYLDGEPLDRILERERQLSLERTVDIVAQVAEALDYAHQNRVVHRDVKPANVVVDAKGRVTVTDFGIAKALDANTLTASGSVIGTPYYMSPEQCKGMRVGAAADQYSLAVMTYQMLGGHLPFTGESAVEIVHKHVADPVPPLGFLRPHLPAGVIDTVERGLAKAPEQRFPSVAEFARMLKSEAEGYTAVARTVRPPGTKAPPSAGALAAARRSRRTRLIVDAAAAVVLVAAVAVALNVPGGWTLSWPPRPDGSVITRAAEPAPPAGATRAPAAGAGRSPQPVVTAPPATTRGGHAPPAASEPQRKRQAAPPAAKPAAHPQPAVPPSRPPSAPAQGQPTAAAPPVVRRPAAETLAPAVPATGFISVGTRPASTIFVNDVARGSRLVNLEVPAGTVRLRFQVQEPTGMWWGQDTTVTVAPGEHKVLHYIDLVRR